MIIIHVGLYSKFLIAFNTQSSVCESNEEVASSNIRIGVFLKKARAIDNL